MILIIKGMIVIRVLVKVRIKMRQVARRIGESKCYLCWLPYLFWSERLLAAKASLWSAPLSSQTLLTAESPHPSCFVLMTCWGMHAATKTDEFSEKFPIQKLYCKFPFILRIYLIVKLYQNAQTSTCTRVCNMIFRKWGGDQRLFGTFPKIHPFR